MPEQDSTKTRRHEDVDAREQTGVSTDSLTAAENEQRVRDDGGAAFPRPIGWNGLSHFDEHEYSDAQQGMSLRDYFAAHAQAHLEVKFIAKVYIKDNKEPNEVELPPIEWDGETKAAMVAWEAAYAYAVADAMLAERAKGGR